MFYRRLEELFFDTDTGMVGGGPSTPTTTTTPMTTDTDKLASGTTTMTSLSHSHGSCKMQQVYTSPNIYVMDDFLTKSELEYFAKKTIHAKQHALFEQSFVDATTINDNDQTPTDTHEETPVVAKEDVETTDNNSSTPSSSNANNNDNNNNTNNSYQSCINGQQRTSTFLSFNANHDAKIAKLERKAAELLGTMNANIEPLQLVQYQQHQYFRVHHDLAEYQDDDDESDGDTDTSDIHRNKSTSTLPSISLPPKTWYSKRRVVTIFCYLNDVEQGGQTGFPLCKITKQIRKRKDSPTIWDVEIHHKQKQQPCRDETVNVSQDDSSPCPPQPAADETIEPSDQDIDSERQGNDRDDDDDDDDDDDFENVVVEDYLKVTPKPGRAVVFCNINRQGQPDPRTVHAGMPVLKGVKYGLNIWICED